MKRITTILMLFVMTFLQAQLFSSDRTNGGMDTNNAFRTVTDWLHYDNGNNAHSFAPSSGTHTLGAYIKLTPSLLSPHVTRQIEVLKAYFGAELTSVTGNITVEIYSTSSATPIYSENFLASSLTPGAWNTLTLSTPYIIDGAEIYIGYKVTTSGHVLGTDNGSNYVPNVNFFIYDGGQLSSWDNVASYNFNIQAGVGGATATNDAAVSTVNLPAILSQSGNTNIEATISNFGANTLNNIDFNYQVDGGTIQTDQLTGLNLATGQSTTVTHSVPWNALVGAHSVDVYISNFNGNGQDDIPTNDHKVKTVSVASNTTQNMPLYEEFTSSTCNPCANLNGNYFNQSFLSTNSGKYNLIKYQMNWPGQGDPYFTAEGNTRRAYYSVVNVPTLYLDGSDGTYLNTTALQQDLDATYAEQAFFAMTSTYTIDATTKDVNVDVNINPYLSGNYTLHCAVVEKTTTGNVGSNGETAFLNVMMKMVPNANGTAVSLLADTPATFNLTANLNGTHIEDYNDLEVVVFLQDDNNKKVMQSAKSIQAAGIEDLIFNNLKIYPNPTNGLIYVDNAEGMTIQIYNVNGRLLFHKELIQKTQIDLNQLATGIYMAKFIKNNKVAVRRLVITK